jgi:hypothetical protein
MFLVWWHGGNQCGSILHQNGEDERMVLSTALSMLPFALARHTSGIIAASLTVKIKRSGSIV